MLYNSLSSILNHTLHFLMIDGFFITVVGEIYVKINCSLMVTLQGICLLKSRTFFGVRHKLIQLICT